MPLADLGLLHLAECSSALHNAALLGLPPAEIERRAAVTIAAIEYVAWRLRLDWDEINACSAAETMRLQIEDRR